MPDAETVNPKSEDLSKETGALSSQHASSSSADVEKIRKDFNELRDKFSDYREKFTESKDKTLSLKDEILTLKDKINTLTTRINLITSVTAIILTIFAVFGFKQMSDLNSIINKTISERLDKTLSYHERFARATTLANSGDCKTPIPILRDLISEKPDDEQILGTLLHCYIQTDSYDSGYETINHLKSQNIFPNKSRSPITFNNAGVVLLNTGVNNPGILSEAHDLLLRAEQISTVNNDPNLEYPLKNLIIYSAYMGDMDKASSYLQRLNRITNTKWEPPLKEEWFKPFIKKKPQIVDDLKKISKSVQE